MQCFAHNLWGFRLLQNFEHVNMVGEKCHRTVLESCFKPTWS